MTVYARYNTTTGIIDSVNSQPITNADQLAALAQLNQAFIEAPDGTYGHNAMVNLDTLTVVPITPSPPIPDLFTQYVAAQINSGKVPADAFHPVSLTQMNLSLASAQLAMVSLTPKV